MVPFDMNFFQVSMGAKENTDDIVQVLWRSRYLIDRDITQKRFPLQAQKKVREETIAIYDPRQSFDKKTAEPLLRGVGLVFPTYEHALRFTLQHGRFLFSENRHIAFLHEPWRGRFMVLCPAQRSLSLSTQSIFLRSDCILAGVRKH